LAQYKSQLPEKITVTCTDNDQTHEAYLDRYVEGKHMDVIINTVRVRLIKGTRLYVGNMAGYEFTAQEPQVLHIKQGR
jgi:hypothetical protein